MIILLSTNDLSLCLNRHYFKTMLQKITYILYITFLILSIYIWIKVRKKLTLRITFLKNMQFEMKYWYIEKKLVTNTLKYPNTVLKK
jgi:hypothetical protein